MTDFSDGWQEACGYDGVEPLSALIVETPSLNALAEQINTAHKEAQAYASKAVDRALMAGDLLNTVKAQLKHGEFIPWCKAHCPDINHRTLQSYMQVSRKLPAEMRSASHLSIREALRLVAGETNESTVIDATPEPTPPWWETGTPETNSAWCLDGDMLHSASVWMDTEGKTVAEISTILGSDPLLIAAAIDPQIPEDLYQGAGDESNPADSAEMRELWNSCKKQTRRKLAYIASCDYDAAVRLAEQCCNPGMAMRLFGIAEMHRSRYRRIVKTDDPLIELVSLRLFSAALKRESLLPAAWMELGMAAILTDSKKPKWLHGFSKAFEVLIHCQKEWIEKPHTRPMAGLSHKPLHLAEIHNAK